MIERVCDECGRWIDERETLYQMKVTLQAEVRTDLTTDAEKSSDQLRDEFEALLRRMESMSADQVEAATDQVHEEYLYVLCPECRQGVHNKLKSRQSIVGKD